MQVFMKIILLGVFICVIKLSEGMPSSFVFPGPSSDDFSSRSFGGGDDFGRHFLNQHHHNPRRRGHGCRGHNCGFGLLPSSGGYYPQNHGGGGGSFASASAGSIGTNNYRPQNSHANAQSASFSFGPFSASFSNAEASSGSNPYSNFDYR